MAYIAYIRKKAPKRLHFTGTQRIVIKFPYIDWQPQKMSIISLSLAILVAVTTKFVPSYVKLFTVSILFKVTVSEILLCLQKKVSITEYCAGLAGHLGSVRHHDSCVYDILCM